MFLPSQSLAFGFSSLMTAWLAPHHLLKDFGQMVGVAREHLELVTTMKLSCSVANCPRSVMTKFSPTHVLVLNRPSKILERTVDFIRKTTMLFQELQFTTRTVKVGTLKTHMTHIKGNNTKMLRVRKSISSIL